MCVIDDVIANLRTTVNNVLAITIRTVLRALMSDTLPSKSLKNEQP